ncbi:DUF4982 domain-containing protein [Lactobacillus sp. ESL0785]|uniref:glycoside hydrolase family 2 TIM barrel-domain containing protein n=1 Tax=Lactobacillus sp. ESL0785 TaxID=2983232 RepID=UPI0023FA106B|nr:glycoside hydrolase family 2 TIM barrel-domain containing protein [Lactobacillus sp. ESL0785]WEV70482.1 DUF4982 domain-containing protein [Lactobacillus sp. ESL0785]
MKKENWNKDWYFWEDKNSFSLVWTTPDNAQKVTLPHDAMIMGKRNKNSSNGGNTGYYDGGTFVYTKDLFVTQNQINQNFILNFEGVYKDAQVFVNGQLAGQNHYGYSNFYVYLNDYLNFDKHNEIRVVTKSGAEPNSRWYSGAGIYRDVYLLTSGSTYICSDNIFVKTRSITNSLATLQAEITINNTGYKNEFCLQTIVYDNENKVVTKEESQVVLFANEKRNLRQRLYVNQPKLWDAEHPNLYTVDFRLLENNDLADEEKVVTGIRQLTLDPINGLAVNGNSVKLRGAAIHHDSGLLGSMTLQKNSYRQIYLLKKAGFNAIRMAHQPAAPALLRACDELGMYILDETFDMWNRSKSDYDYSLNFSSDWHNDVAAMAKKDFNHPSVILYSIGNEIPEIATDQGLKICEQINSLIKKLDDTRYTLAAINGMYTVGTDLLKIIVNVTYKQEKKKLSDQNVNEFMTYMDKYLDQIVTDPAISKQIKKVAAQIDIVGYNYMGARYKQDSDSYPNQIMVGSETYPPEIARNWNNVLKLSQVIGDFTWTGWDYLGEAGVGVPSYHFGDGGFGAKFPILTSNVGDFDLIGFRRPISYYREIVFGLRQAPYIAVQDPHHYGKQVQLTPWILSDTVSSWSWDVPENSKLIVEVYSGGTEVELFLNGHSLGRKPAGEKVNYRTLFETNYVKGELVAVSYDNGKELARTELLSAQGATQLKLKPETLFNQLDFHESHNLSYIDVKLVDDQGTTITDEDVLFTVEVVSGNAKILAVGSGNPKPITELNNKSSNTYQGRALIIIERTGKEVVSLNVKTETGLSITTQL